MQTEEILIPARSVQSLAWEGETLVDWAGGHCRYSLDGKIVKAAYCSYGGSFDAAIASPGGEYAVIYTKLGTKGVLLRRGKIVREINRSFSHAEDYEYPVALFRMGDGREALAHCPNRCDTLEIEDAETGRSLTVSHTRKPMDFFHSRLQVSPNGKYLLSAGWVWHPLEAVAVYDVTEALKNPAHLDGPGIVPREWGEDECNAAFLGNNRLAVSAHISDETPVNQLHIYDLAKPGERTVTGLAGITGTMMPVGNSHLLCLYEYPKLLDLRSGEIVQEWRHIKSGTQTSSILRGHNDAPQTALDVQRQRCAIAGEKGITVLVFKE